MDEIAFSLQPFRLIHILNTHRHNQIPGPAFLIEIHPKHLAAHQRDFVEGEDQFADTAGRDGPKPIGGFGEDGFLVLKAALPEAFALNGKAGSGEFVAHRGIVLEGNQEEQHVAFVEDVFAEDVNAVSACPYMVKFLFHGSIVF